MADLDNDFKYFIDNHDQIYASYPNSFVVISNKGVKGAGSTFEDALNLALKSGMIPGEFLIQECTEGDKAYTQKFHSRVIF